MLRELFFDLAKRVKQAKVFEKKHRGAAALEAAIVLPVMILVSLGGVNMTLAGYAAVAATNAANYGARVGSVSQQNAAGRAITAAEGHASQTGIGEYTVSAYGGGRRGSQIVVEVHWEFPNWFRGIMAFVGGGGTPAKFQGDARSTFRQEGW